MNHPTLLMEDYSIERNYLNINNDSKLIIDTFKEIINIKNDIELPLTESNKILAFGRGYNPKLGINDIVNLSKKLGCHIAATRPVHDMGILSSQFILGKTAIDAKPEIYIGFGISGSVQHIGAINAKKIIAINNNKNSAIFRHADIAILEDSREVTSFLLENL